MKHSLKADSQLAKNACREKRSRRRHAAHEACPQDRRRPDLGQEIKTDPGAQSVADVIERDAQREAPHQSVADMSNENEEAAPHRTE